MKRVFIYIRVSTQEQAEEGYSLGEQEERLKKYCDAMEWDLVHVYSDPGYSGGSMDRPALQLMISEIQKGNADIVLVDKLDRLSRSQYDTLYLIKKVFTENHVAFVSRAEAFDTSSSFGMAMLGILAVFAELERERIKERMQEGKEGRIKEGKFRGGNCIPYGYDYDSDAGILIPNEYESMIVQEIFQMTAERKSFYDIRNILNDRKIPSKTNRKWCDGTIRAILKNPIYLGKQHFHDEWIDALHQPIVSDDLFEKVQKVLEERKITNAKYLPGKKYNSPLGGILYCKKCGAKYQWKKTRDKAVYVCYSRSKSDPKLVKDPTCKNRRFEDHLLDDAVFQEIRKLKSAEYIQSVKSSVDMTDRIRIVRQKAESIDKQMEKMLDLYSMDGMNIDLVSAKIKALSDERTVLKEELDAMEKQAACRDNDEIMSMAKWFDVAVESGDTIAIHDAIVELIEYIELDDEEVHIHWKF